MISIQVCEPAKFNDKVGSYVSYKVVTSGLTSEVTSRNRRYSEFEWLQKELARTFPGVIVPSLPAKGIVGSFSVDFVESRQRALEKFLQRIAAHPDLSAHQLFISFLSMEDASFQRTMTEAKDSKPQIAQKATSWFSSVVNMAKNSGKKVELEKSPQDLQVDEIMGYIESFDDKIHKLTHNLKQWNSNNGASANILEEMGKAYGWVGTIPDDPMSPSIASYGKTLEGSAALGNAYVNSNQVDAIEPFQEYYRLVESIRYSYKKRDEMKEAYINALTDVEVKQKDYNSVLGVNGKESLANEKQQTVYEAQSKTDTAKMEFNACTDRFIKEFETLKGQKALDIKSTMEKFAEVQVAFHRKEHELWLQLLPSLQEFTISGEPQTGSSAYNSYSSGSRMPPPPPAPGQQGGGWEGGNQSTGFYSNDGGGFGDTENVGV